MEAPPIQYVAASDGWSIAYSVAGTGPSLIYMPRPINHINLEWAYNPGLLGGLAARFRLIQFDQRGQGLSGRGLATGVQIADYLADLEAVAARAESPFYLWGHAFHADLAVRFAVSNPERVKGLILQTVRTKADDQISTRLLTVAQNEWDTFLGITRASLFMLDDAGPPLEEMRQIVTQADWLARVEAFRGSDITHLLPRVRCPTLVVTMTGSAVDWLEGAKQVAALLPDGRLTILPPQRGVLAPAVIAFANEIEGAAPPKAASEGHLSNRELEVLKLLAAGRSNKQIAAELVISLNTVQRHVSNIFAKTGAANRADAVSYAHRNSLS